MVNGVLDYMYLFALACSVVECVFFFQAEDGIRDDLVTGVQTCALPIFNILAGRDLIRRTEGGEAFALTTPLITATSGEKLGKRAGNATWLDPALTSPYQYYQYWRNTEDAAAGRFMRMFPFQSLYQIAD